MKSSKVSYVVQSVIGMVVWIGLTIIVSFRVADAVQLDRATQVAIWAFLWGLVICFICVLVFYYKKLGKRELG
jgi:hypothetical protein